MRPFQVSVSGPVNARTDRVYAILADYKEGHPRILPRRDFGELKVEQGGKGAGTIIHVDVTLLGYRHPVRAPITEPEPGRVLIETDLDRGGVTTFMVDHSEDGFGSVVTISSELKSKSGLLGVVERCFTRLVLRPLYRRVLKQLAEVAEGHSNQASSAA